MAMELFSSDDMSKEMHKTNGMNGKSEISITTEEIKKRFEFVVDYFQKQNPNPTTELKYKNGYELLIAVILSAQTQDKRVNMVTQGLFKKYPTPEDLAKAVPEEVYRCIDSVNYAGKKSEYIVDTANILVTKYGGKIPEKDDDLQALPGVGRKTAHVIMATLFNKPVIAVDTHVLRVSERIGLATYADKPAYVEKQLMIRTPREAISRISHWLILHGRYTCMAKNPQCNKCGIREVCRYYADSH